MGAEAKQKTGAKKPAAPKVERPALKKRLKTLKQEREAAKAAKDETTLERVRRKYRRTTHALRRTAAPKAKAAKKE